MACQHNTAKRYALLASFSVSRFFPSLNAGNVLKMITSRLRGFRPKLLMRSNSTVKPKSLSLSRLPVPDLRKTLDRYLKSLEPFLLEDEAHGGLPFQTAYSLRAKWADEFAAGVGKLCQDRLLGPYLIPPFEFLVDFNQSD